MHETFDELDVNPFFNFLQTNLRGKYQKAQELSCLICVPVSKCLAGIQFTQHFADFHILKPVVHSSGMYVTSHTKGWSFTLSNDRTMISSNDFSPPLSVKILHEELGYNEMYKPYRILVLTRPLDPNVEVKENESEKSLKSEPVTEISFERCVCVCVWEGGCKYLNRCKEHLHSFADLTHVLLELDEQLRRFEKGYLILKTCLPDASKRLLSLLNSFYKKCVNIGQGNNSEVLYQSLECYIQGKVCDKIYPIIITNHHVDDSCLRDKLSQLKSLTMADVGVKEKFRCDLRKSISALKTLSIYKTPLEKAYCVKKVLDCIKDEISTEIQDYRALGAPALIKRLLTSDDLIPIMLYVMSRCNLEHLASDIYYIEHFAWSLSNKDELSFCFTTMKACVEYARHLNLSKLRVQYITMETEKEQSKVHPTGESLKSSVTGPSEATVSLRHLDQQLDRMTHLLNESTNQLSDNLNRKMTIDIFSGQGKKSDERIMKRHEELGAFLASLDEDDVTSSFG